MSDNIWVARAAVLMAVSSTRDEEAALKKSFAEKGITVGAVDFGGEYVSALPKIVERAVVAAKREKVISDTHHHEGAVAGATRDALAMVAAKALGFNVGGKVGLARAGEHVNVAIFLGVGLGHLDDMAVALAHRAIHE
ncbi:MAG: HutP family protein [Bacillota bacterium]